MNTVTRQFSILVCVLSLMLASAIPAFAKTINPIGLISDGGYTVNANMSSSVQLFIDRSERGSSKKFWVRVEVNPGIPYWFDNVAAPLLGDDQVSPRPAPDPISVYVKYFPLSRYYEVLRTMRGIRTFGLVNPYPRGDIICDLNNTNIRYGTRTITMAYNCGASDSPDADAATFKSEILLNQLLRDTVAKPDMKTTVPQ